MADTLKDLRNEIYALRRSLQKDLREVREARKDDELISKRALESYAKATRITKTKSVRDMDKGELQSLRRQLQHIRELKSSTLSGAIEQKTRLIKLVPNITNLSKTQQEKVWSIYSKITEDKIPLKDYKYSLYGAISDLVENTKMSEEALVKNIDTIFDKIYESDGDIDEDELQSKTEKKVLQYFGRIFKQLR